MTDEKSFPRYACHVELAAGEKPDDCVLNYGAPNDCIYGFTSPGRPRKSPHTCKYWRKVATPESLLDRYREALEAIRDRNGWAGSVARRALGDE